MPGLPYTPHGPFTNGSAPGIDQSFLNAVEAALQALNSGSYDTHISANGSGIMTVAGLITGANLLSIPTHAQSVNGSTSGTLTINEFFTGSTSVKLIIFFFNNYKNTGSALTITLNTAFTTGAVICNMGGNGVNFFSGGSQVTGLNILVTLASTGGSQASSNSLLPYSIGQIKSAFDTIKEPGGNAATATGIGFCLGY